MNKDELLYKKVVLIWFLYISLMTICPLSAFGAAPSEQWNKTFGGPALDEGYSVKETGDGGYIIAGTARSYGAGDLDVWLIKTDSNGTEQWNRTFGGSERDEACSIQVTRDGSYIVAGKTISYGAGDYDAWLIKTDDLGIEQWNRTFGGLGWDWGYCIQETEDGGYIIAGATLSYGEYGDGDAWLIKTDSNGTEQWNRTFGGSKLDEAYSVHETMDGGYIVAGTTGSFCEECYDVWLVKTDSAGIEQWNKTFSSSGLNLAHPNLIHSNVAHSVQETGDGSYIVAGITSSISQQEGDYNAWLIKIDSLGEEQWNRTFGGPGWGKGYCVQETEDGGYIIAGTMHHGGYDDVWLIKTDDLGREQWNKTFGGADWDECHCIQETEDGGYIVAGTTRSYGVGGGDAWLIKIDSVPVVTVDKFEASSKVMGLHERSTLSWTVSNADSVFLNGEKVALSGSKTVNPRVSTTYTLIAQKGDKKVHKEIKVVVEKPKINYFEADYETISPAESSRLSWDVDYAEAASIESKSAGSAPEEISVNPKSGTYSVSPRRTTDYTLKAISEGETATQSIRVVVKRPAIIERFEANPSGIFRGGNSTLSWSVRNADEISIEPEPTKRPLETGLANLDEHGMSGQVVVEPQETTTYTLTAWNEGKKATETVLAKAAASVKINVSPMVGVNLSVFRIHHGEFWYQNLGIGDRSGVSDQFGSSLASGDFNNDGYNDLAIGVPGEDIIDEKSAGAVNVLYGSSDGLKKKGYQYWFEDRCIGGRSEPNDYFGRSVASGDFNKDGYDDLAVGVPGEDIVDDPSVRVVGDTNRDGYDDLPTHMSEEFIVDNPSEGAVNVFYGSSGGLKEQRSQKWYQDLGIGDSSDPGDGFGSSLTTGDFNRDGYDDLAIGVIGEDIEDRSAGAVNIIYGSSGGLKKEASQLWYQDLGIGGSSEPLDMFGFSVASGDFNKDGYDDLAIGVPGEAIDDKSRAGAVNVLYGSSGGLKKEGSQIWYQDQGLGAKSEPSDEFGRSVTTGDFNKDGYDDLAIGVPGEAIGNKSNKSFAGAVNVLYGSSGGLKKEGSQIWYQDKGTGGSSDQHESFGESMVSGDFNKDGYDDLAIGVPGEDIGNKSRAGGAPGAVDVLHGSSDGLKVEGYESWYQDRGIGDSSEAYDEFGSSITTGDFNKDGYDDLAIGVPGEEIDGKSLAGAVNIIYN